MKRKYDHPVLLGVLTEDGKEVEAWCPYCVKYHIHGAGEHGEAAEGHRAAHCINEKSPFKSTGYSLLLPENAHKATYQE